jgi:hypothetical protein
MRRRKRKRNRKRQRKKKTKEKKNPGKEIRVLLKFLLWKCLQTIVDAVPL